MEDGVYIGDCVCGGQDVFAHENRRDIGVEVDYQIAGVHRTSCEYQ